MSTLSREDHEYSAPRLLDRRLDLAWLNLELLAFGLLVVLSVIAHLWGLGHMAMHHDESVTSWTSWRYYTGATGFNCAGSRVAPSYCYDPVYHGPAYYVLSLISFFLFGDGEAQARLPEALAGIGLTLSAWMLRPYFGRAGTLAAAALLTFAPSLLYFTRFSRHDALILLWAFWMVLGVFRYLDTRRPRYLYLFGAATALAMATHELYYILFFIFGMFLLIRLADELLPRRNVLIGLAVALAVSLALMLLNPPITAQLRGGGLGLLFSTVLGMGLLLVRSWPPEPRVSDTLRMLWYEERQVVGTAAGILVATFVLLFSNFFTDPRGVLDGLYQGLAYWLGSQHEFARGKQPWYYYLMLLPVYEPIALVGALSAVSILFSWGRTRIALAFWMLIGALLIYGAGLLGGLGIVLSLALIGLAVYTLLGGRPAADTRARGARASAAAPAAEAGGAGDGLEEPAEPPAAPPQLAWVPAPLFPLFLAFWFIGALVAFSWAGEKMPWLVTHIALPGNLLAAWLIGRLIDAVAWRAIADRRAALIPAALTLALVALSVALWRLSAAGEDQAGQAALLQALVPLLIAGLLIFGLLTIGQRLGGKITRIICALTVFGLLAAYTVRASWMVVYDHPDTPIELLVYVQSPPDVPLIVDELRTLAINLTRNRRLADDPTGGHTMPIILDAGDENADGSLAWPYQWYLRDFQRIESRKADFFANPTADAFMVPVDRNQPDGEKEYAPVVMVYVPHITDATRQALEENYVKRYDSKLNWYFPEGDLSGCDPRQPGYKRFYYNSSTRAQAKADSQCQNLNSDELPYEPFYAPLVWPFQPENFNTVKNYLLYRQLPAPLQVYGRELQVWMRKDLVASGEAGAGSPAGGTVKLVAQEAIGSAGNGPGQLAEPRGLAVDAQGTLYVADTGNQRIQVFDAQGQPKLSVGTLGNGEGQFNEPRGVAADAQGNIYVADTWNARVVKLDPAGKFLKSWGAGDDIGGGRSAMMTDGSQAGNNAAPLGFYGPRALTLDAEGNVYIADTGNKRVVVTDSEGTYLYQWGYAGNQPGAFNEPVGIAVDAQGDVYVADTWNGRVQIFGRDESGRVAPLPKLTWRVPGWQPNTYDDPFIAVSAEGQVFVSVPGRDQVLYTTLTGEPLLRWGGKGNDFASLATPSGLAVAPDGTLLAVDRGNSRVLRFKLPASGR